MSFEILSLVVNEGKRRMGQMLATGKSFKVTHFGIGASGHDPLDVVTALAPDPSAIDCPGMFFGPKPISSYFFAGEFCPVFVCELEEGEAVGNVSNICLLATIVYSPIPGDPEVGTQFLFVVGNFPLKVRTDLEKWEIQVAVQF